MDKKNIIFIFSFFLLFAHAAHAASLWSNLHPSIILGSGFTRVGSAQNLWLDTSPEPGLENNYSSKGKQRGSFLLGFALERNYATRLENLESAFGLQADYLRNPSITGVVRPMVNVAPDFDTLNYSYDMTSYLLLATAKLSKLDIFHHLGAYLQIGAGCTLNNFSDYTEISPEGSSSAPMLSPFGNKSNTRFAYSIGAGVLYQIGHSAKFSIGYAYINTGRGGLSTSPVQDTNNSLNFSPLSSQFLILSLTV